MERNLEKTAKIYIDINKQGGHCFSPFIAENNLCELVTALMILGWFVVEFWFAFFELSGIPTVPFFSF